MWVENKYKRWYFSIVNRARERAIKGYTEGHHVIPKSMGGLNDKSNIVKLTFREHFLVHWLLMKCTEGKAKGKMRYAFLMMRKGRKEMISSWQYAQLRKVARERRHSKETKRKISDSSKGKKKSISHIENMKKAAQNRSPSHARKWLITYVDGKQIEVFNLKQYARENNLNYLSLVYNQPLDYPVKAMRMN